MGQLTNLFVSESYQGLLKLADSSTGLTTNLQSVQDGLGGNSPLQISQTEVNISGTFTVNGAPVGGVDTGSLVKNVTGLNDDITVTKGDGTTSSFTVNNVESSSFSQTSISSSFAQNSVSASYAPLPSGVISGSVQISDLGFATTSSVSSSISSLSGSIATTDLAQDGRLTSLESNSGSQQLEINQKLNTSSFNSYTSSNDARVNSLESKTGSYATTGSNVFNGSQTISGSLDVTGTINAVSGTFTYLKTIYETSSVIFSSGSNIFGDEASDVQTLNGTVNIPLGNVNVTGAVTASAGFKGNLEGTASFATNAATSSISFDLVVIGKCDNPAGLTKGTIVRITGANGDNPLFNTASWIDDANSANTLGMLSEDVAYNSFANVVVQGKVIGINTNGMTAGQMLYLSSSGQYTTTIPPAPYHEVRLGQVLRPNLNNGSAYVSIDNGYELSELHDVDITNPVNGDLLVYRSGSYGQWVNENGSELGFATTSSLSQYTTTSSFNSYTGSNDSKVNSLISQTGSYITETESGSFVTNVAGGPVSFEDQITITKGNGSSTTITINNVTNADSSSYATNALSASYAPQSPLPSGVISGSAQIVDLGFATTGSVDTLSGSIAVTDLAQDGRLNSLETATSSYITSAQTSSMSVASASYATQALSASWAPDTTNTGSFATTGSNVFLGDQTVDGDITISGSYNSLVVPMDNYIKLFGAPTLSNTSAAIQFYSGSGAAKWLNMQPVPTSLDGDVAISEFPVNNHFMYFRMLSHTIQFEAPLSGTGSAPIENKSGFINNTNYFPGFASERGFVNSGSMVVRGNLFNLSNNTSFNPDLYVTNSLVGQTNLIKGWGDNPTPGGAGSNQNNYTGSLTITGSNNTVALPQVRATNYGLGVGHQGYISGSDNVLGGNTAGIYMNTNSQIFPKTQGNLVGYNSAIGMTFTSSSLGNPIIANNSLFGGNLILSHGSGSVVASANLLNGAGITSTQNFVTNVRPSISANIVGNTVTLNHISSSINYAGNINNSSVTVNNHLSSSITNNSLFFNNNMMLGGSQNTGVQIYVSGSQSTNFARQITDNLIGGRSNIVSSSFVSSSQSNLISTLIYGNGLTVSGSHISGSGGGSAFLGRFNDTNSLHLSQDIVLAVGTGTAAGSRRTGLYVTSGSLVGISGSMDVKGPTTLTGSVQGNVTPLTVTSNTASLDLNVGNFFELQLTGSLDVRIEPTNIKPGQTVNIKLNTTGSGTVSFPTTVKQQSGSAYVPTTTVGTDIITMVSFDSSNLYLANVKDLL